MADQGTNTGATAESSSVVTLALFGLGRAGSIHLANIVANRKVQLKYIVESDQSKWASVKTKFNLLDVKFLTSQETNIIYEDDSLNAVMVATPTSSHEEYITKSLEAKKAVFTEKPVSEDSEAVERCYQLAAKVGKPLFCAFNRRYTRSYIPFEGIIQK